MLQLSPMPEDSTEQLSEDNAACRTYFLFCEKSQHPFLLIACSHGKGTFFRTIVWKTHTLSKRYILNTGPFDEFQIMISNKILFIALIHFQSIKYAPSYSIFFSPFLSFQELEFQDLTAVLNCIHSFIAAKVASVDPLFIDSQSIARKYTYSN